MTNSVFVIVLHRLRVPFLVLIFSYSFAMIGLLVIDGVTVDGKPYQMGIFDAFYFVTYTATTIGFGETPYDFTYSQRIWTTFIIYIVVIGWFYSIGAIVGLIQNQQFLMEIARSKFKRQIKSLKQKYIIVLGYNYITSEIIKKAISNQVRVVVIEKDSKKVNSLLIESYTPIDFDYLFGVLDGDNYIPFVAERPEDEKEVFFKVLKYLEAVDTPIYHYHSFEPQRFRQLMLRYRINPAKKAGLLKRFVDVYDLLIKPRSLFPLLTCFSQ
jgi:predicted RecB family nuclease